MILPEATRVERVVYLTKLFIVRKELTTAEAAAMTGVTQRTIQRDFAEMARCLEIYPDRGKWYYMPDDGRVSISPY